jgi:hypothetical protein
MTIHIGQHSSFRSVLLALLMLTLFSCQKNLDYFVVDDNALNAPDTTWYNSINSDMPVIALKNDLLIDFSRDSFTLQGGVINQFNMSSGISASIPGGSILDSIGQSYLGPVTATSMLMNSKGSKIKMGISDISNGQQLGSGGCYYFKLSGVGGQQLFVAPNASLEVNFQSVVPFSYDMQLFAGEAISTFDFNWEPTTSQDTVSFSGGTYHAYSNLFGFIATSYFVDLPSSQQTRLALNLPANYTNANTMAYIVYDQLPSVIALIPDFNTRKFRSEEIAKNEPATIVVLSKQGGNYFLGHASITTHHAGQSGYQEINITPTITTLNDMKNFISTL